MQAPSTSGFVGESRRRVLGALTDAFDAVRSESRSRVVVLASPPGWGKTRIVQELYAALAARQPAPAYWPRAIVDVTDTETLNALSRARKAVYPTRVDVPENAQMDWMWWGVLCQRRGDGHLSQAMFDDAAQLYAHAATLMRPPIDDLGGRAFDVGSATISVLGLLGLAVAPPVGAAITIAGAVREGWANTDIVRRLVDWWSSNRGTDPARVVTTDSPVNHEDRVAQLIEGLVRLTQARPLIVVVDDAQFADDTLVRVLDGLLREAGSRVLVIATAWPSHLDAGDEALPFAGWARSFAAECPDRFARLDLEALAADEIAAVVQAELPAAADIAPRLYELYGTNLLAIHGVLRLPRVRRLAERGALAPDALTDLPRDLEALFAEHWAGLPEAIQQVLAVAAQPHGTRYLPDVVAAACAQTAFVDAARERLSDGVSPHAWAREIDATLHGFVEPILHQIAKARGEELLLDEEIDAWQAAIVDAVAEVETSELSVLARSVLFEQHLALVRDGSVPADIGAARSAYALAELRASHYDYAQAIELGTLAVQWSGLPLDDPQNLIARRTVIGWLQDAGRTEDALREIEFLIPDQTRVHGPDDLDTVHLRASHGWLLRDAGRVLEAVTVLVRVLVDVERLSGPDDHETLAARANVATVIASAGDNQESQRRFAELLPDVLRVLGPDHLLTLRVRSQLALAAGDPDEAVRQLEQVLAARLRLGGADEPETITARQDVGMWLQTAGRTDEALEAFEAVLGARLRLLGPDHPDTLRSRNDVAGAWLEMGRVDEALRELDALVEHWTRTFGPDDPGTLEARGFRADGMVAAGHAADATRELEQLAPDCVRVFGPTHPHTLMIHRDLADQLAQTGRVDEAARTAETMLAGQERMLGRDHPDTRESRHQLALWLGESDRDEEAAQHFEILVAANTRALGPDHRETLVARHNLAYFQLQAGRTEEGLQALKPLLDDMVRALGPEDPETLNTFEFIEALVEAAQEAEAEG